jgi:hypothetical protein
VTGTPASFGKAQRAVMFVQHPNLSEKDKKLLSFLVTFWPNVFPGMPALMALTGNTARGVRKQLAKLISLGLLECTNAGHVHRGVAPQYRICWEHPSFPDSTPAGESLNGASEKSDLDDEKAELYPDKSSPLPITKAELFEPKTAGRGNESEQKEELFSQKEELCPGKSSPQAVPKQIPSQPSKPTTAQTENSKPGWLEGWILKNLDQVMAPPGRKIRDVLDSKARTKGPNTVLRALDKFVNRQQGFGGVKQPWSLLLSEIDTWIAACEAEDLKAEQAKQEELLIEESIRRQQAADHARMNAIPQSSIGEASFDDLL